jgi:hypothetical protein
LESLLLHVRTALKHLNQTYPVRMTKTSSSVTTVAAQRVMSTDEIPITTVRFHGRRSISITKTNMMTACPYIVVIAHSKRTFRYTAVVEVDLLMNLGLYPTRDTAAPREKIRGLSVRLKVLLREGGTLRMKT